METQTTTPTAGKRLKMTEGRIRMLLRCLVSPIVADNYHSLNTARWLDENDLAETQSDGRALIVRITPKGALLASEYEVDSE